MELNAVHHCSHCCSIILQQQQPNSPPPADAQTIEMEGTPSPAATGNQNNTTLNCTAHYSSKAEGTMMRMTIFMPFQIPLLGSLAILALASHVNVSHISSSLMTGRQKNMIPPKVLAKPWSISIEAATKMLDKTTQKGIQTVANPFISW
jgi:hypothetical protein